MCKMAAIIEEDGFVLRCANQEILDKVKAAIAKTESKKPYSQQENGEVNYYCECGHYLLDEAEFELECLRPSFCESCGQAIDWSDAK